MQQKYERIVTEFDASSADMASTLTQIVRRSAGCDSVFLLCASRASCLRALHSLS